VFPQNKLLGSYRRSPGTLFEPPVERTDFGSRLVTEQESVDGVRVRCAAQWSSVLCVRGPLADGRASHHGDSVLI